MPDPITISEGPIRDLFLAINHYVSTGDHLGEGVALDGVDETTLILIAVDPSNKTDVADYDAFAARMRQVGLSNRALAFSEQRLGRNGRFLQYAYRIDTARARDLARELVQEPGPVGWGSLKAFVDEHAPGLREKILSGEGA